MKVHNLKYSINHWAPTKMRIEKVEWNNKHYLLRAYRLSLLLNEESQKSCHLLFFFSSCFNLWKSLKRFDGSKYGCCKQLVLASNVFLIYKSGVLCRLPQSLWLSFDTNQYWLRSCAIPFVWIMMDISMEYIYVYIRFYHSP